MTTVADADLTTWNRYATSPKYRGSNPFGSLTATSLTKDAITWTFSEAVTYGQYVTGDYWVLDEGAGITVNSVSPSPTGTGASYRNGSMVNPSVQGKHGYSGKETIYFDQAYAETFPLVMAGGDSLISTESTDVGGTSVYDFSVSSSATVTSKASVLTVVSSTPSADAFRPCYAGGTKTEYLTTNLNTGLLQNISLTSKPDLTYLNNAADWLARPWIDHLGNWVSRYTHPISNMPNYGREIGLVISEAAVLLNLDYTLAEKQELLYGLIQFGIDIYGMTETGVEWAGDGGHENGRKFPLALAGLMLGDAGMSTAATTVRFGESDQTYYGVTDSLNAGQSKVAYWGTLYGTAGYYEAGCTGAGSKTRAPAALDDDACEGYRNCCTSYTWVGYAIASTVMGQTAMWGDDKFFQYVDRWMEYGLDTRVSDGVASFVFPGDGGTVYIEDFWDQERGNY